MEISHLKELLNDLKDLAITKPPANGLRKMGSVFDGDSKVETVSFSG